MHSYSTLRTVSLRNCGLPYLQAMGKTERKIEQQKRNSWRLTRQLFSETETAHARAQVVYLILYEHRRLV